jgi:molybdopterin-biosynthesis enzyme MoeA-like protein
MLDALPLAPVTVKSTKFPAGTTTLPVSVQDPPGATEHTSDVFAILPGVPCRSITFTVFVWRENTLNCVAVQPAGTHVKTESVSVPESIELFTE